MDPRQRTSRHTLTPANLSTAVVLSDLPASWTAATASSVAAGSGPVVSVQPRTDPRSGRLLSVAFEYRNARAAKDAADLLGAIGGLPCRVELTVPADWRERAGAPESRAEIELTRDAYPWDTPLELPFQMVTQVPIPRRPLPGQAQAQVPTPSAQVPSAPVASAPVPVASAPPTDTTAIPDILAKASQHLPALVPGALQPTSPLPADAASRNLSKVPPLQLIEVLASLKALLSGPQGGASRPQLEQFLGANREITVAVGQALLEMGLLDYAVVASVTQTQAPVHTPAHTPTPPVQAPPVAPVLRTIDEAKLLTAPENQRAMIRQVLTLTDAQLGALPDAQRQMVEGLRRDYLR